MNDIKYANLLESTFLPIKGISRNKEKALWDSGIVKLSQLREKYFSHQMKLFEDYNDITTEMEIALQNNDVDFFLDKLPSSELFRAALTCYKEVMFLDIETTGLSRWYSYITLIGWIINGEYKCLIKGNSPKDFFDDLDRAKVLITFNGSIFDIPFIKKEYQVANLSHAHIDLRFFSKRFGYTGGQKQIERTLKIRRPNGIGDIDGKEAVVLWYKYLSGELKSLRKLIQYNYYDIVGMQKIFDKIIEKHIKKKEIPDYDAPIYKFSKHKATLKRKPLRPLLVNTKQIIKKRTINELLDGSKSKVKIIGIDLTGSEKKASGCCVLDNNKANTCLLNTDNELIDFILVNRPFVVSIDSPLSLPIGRKKVSDDDEGRDKYGIMRSCERQLKKRGVNVYPCLIPSMQKLTARGMNLARRLRFLGVPVIESFPGAAQDVLKIPRKRTDLYFLKQGLVDFGITGEFLNYNISHDELDAITSAVVGLFFWKGKFEALGNDEENYLIIPGPERDDVRWGKRKVVGFSGEIASGKTTAATLLKNQGFHYVRFSQVLEFILKSENKEVNRNTLQELGNKIYQEKGQYWLCERLARLIPTNENVVIDGLRHPEDHSFFVEYFGPDFIHIFIDTDLLIRRERYIKRNGISAAKFNSVVEHPVESNISKLLNIADFVIKNNRGKSEFEETILRLIQNF